MQKLNKKKTHLYFMLITIARLIFMIVPHIVSIEVKIEKRVKVIVNLNKHKHIK
jgi:hypothetical protein